MNRKISLLVPARGRPSNLERSISSALQLATDPGRVEVLYRFDDDDRLLDANLAVAKNLTPSASIIVGERWGYSRMHDYFNQLAAASTGSWLVNWNDDMEWLTQGWDALLDSHSDLFCVQMPRRDCQPHADHTVPVTGRKVYEALGHLSKSSLCDAWISEVTKEVGIFVDRNDVVFKHHCLAPVERGNIDEIAAFRSSAMDTLRASDVNKLRTAATFETKVIK